jgi:hypothetical protein
MCLHAAPSCILRVLRTYQILYMSCNALIFYGPTMNGSISRSASNLYGPQIGNCRIYFGKRRTETEPEFNVTCSRLHMCLHTAFSCILRVFHITIWHTESPCAAKKTVLNGGRCLQMQAALPASLWTEACAYLVTTVMNYYADLFLWQAAWYERSRRRRTAGRWKPVPAPGLETQVNRQL